MKPFWKTARQYTLELSRRLPYEPAIPRHTISRANSHNSEKRETIQLPPNRGLDKPSHSPCSGGESAVRGPAAGTCNNTAVSATESERSQLHRRHTHGAVLHVGGLCATRPGRLQLHGGLGVAGSGTAGKGPSEQRHHAARVRVSQVLLTGASQEPLWGAPGAAVARRALVGTQALAGVGGKGDHTSRQIWFGHFGLRALECVTNLSEPVSSLWNGTGELTPVPRAHPRELPFAAGSSPPADQGCGSSRGRGSLLGRPSPANEQTESGMQEWAMGGGERRGSPCAGSASKVCSAHGSTLRISSCLCSAKGKVDIPGPRQRLM